MPGSFVNTVRRELDEAFSQAFGNRTAQLEQSFSLPLTIWGDDEHVYVHADVPGFDRESLDVVFKDGQLWIRGERKVTLEDGKYWHNERMFGQFERAVAIPDTIDPGSIEAELTDGVLMITLSKKPEAQPTRIAIKSADNGGKKRLADSQKKE
jgi:HSP20 family protein